MSDLVDACRAWCVLTGVEPANVDGADQLWVEKAVEECGIPFDQLNGQQRRLIAGVANARESLWM
jgi:hypothetical protein